MDTPKQDVFGYLAFPPDIWAYLVELLPGDQLGRLKMTGSKLMWNRIKFPRVVTSVNLGTDFLLFKSWPSFLNEFPNLETLSFRCQSRLRSEINLNLRMIPSTLRKLELSRFATLQNFLVDHRGGKGATLKLAECLPNLEFLDLMDAELDDYSWMNHSPPHLATLKINEWDGIVPLPDSLIHFETGSFELKRRSAKDVKLPPGLESFITRVSSERPEQLFPLFPPVLQLFSCVTMPLRSSTPFDLLPRYMTSLTVYNVLNWPSVTPEDISDLPPTLTELNCRFLLPCATWPLLPPKLLILSFEASSSSCTMPSEELVTFTNGNTGAVYYCPLESLPRSLTSLTITSNKSTFFGPPPARKQDSYFPPQLETLDMRRVQLSSDVAALLPSSLIYLAINNLNERVCEHLPNSLRTLKAESVVLTPNLIKFIPRSVTSLRLILAEPSENILSLADHPNDWFHYETGEKLYSISELPGFATHKQFLLDYGPEATIDWAEYSLPPKLTRLSIPNSRSIGDRMITDQPLPHLLKLKMSHSIRFTDTSIPLLSRHLTTLVLPASEAITGDCFPFLPRSLTNLGLRSSDRISDSDIQHLPRTLRKLDLSSATRLTNACVPDLPPILEELDMLSNETITPSSFKRFPYTLRSCRLYHRVEFANWSVRYGNLQTRKGANTKEHNQCSSM